MKYSMETLAVLASFLLLPACNNTDADTGSGGAASTSAATGASDSTSSGTGGSAPCVEDDLKAFVPFSGPGYDASQGGLIGTPQDSYLVATTFLVERPDAAAQAEFLQLSTAVMSRANQSDGFIGLTVALSKKCNTARTITVWKSADDMMTFVASPEHSKAMAATSEVGLSGTVTTWNATPADFPPTFETAMAKLEGVAPFY